LNKTTAFFHGRGTAMRKLTKKMVDSLVYEGAVSGRGTKGLHIVMDNQIPGGG